LCSPFVDKFEYRHCFVCDVQILDLRSLARQRGGPAEELPPLRADRHVQGLGTHAEREIIHIAMALATKQYLWPSATAIILGGKATNLTRKRSPAPHANPSASRLAEDAHKGCPSRDPRWLRWLRPSLNQCLRPPPRGGANPNQVLANQVLASPVLANQLCASVVLLASQLRASRLHQYALHESRRRGISVQKRQWARARELSW
jgi:hypothetical protein